MSYRDPTFLDCHLVSSHNTYLIGTQYGSKSYYHYYLAFLNYFNGGCLEIDPSSLTRDGHDLLVYHHGFKIMTDNNLRLSVLLKLIIKWLRLRIIKIKNDKLHHNIFNPIKLGPIILSIDNKSLKHISEHRILWNVLNDTLYHSSNRDLVVPYDTMISLDEPIFKYCGKIILRWNMCTNKPFNNLCNNQGIFSPTDIDLISTDKTKTKTKTTVQDKDKDKDSSWITIPRPEVSAEQLVSSKLPVPTRLTMTTIVQGTQIIEDGQIYPYLIRNTGNYLVRVFPCPFRHSNSGNYGTFKYFQHGIHCIALNFQKIDCYLLFYLAMFGQRSLIIQNQSISHARTGDFIDLINLESVTVSIINLADLTDLLDMSSHKLHYYDYLKKTKNTISIKSPIIYRYSNICPVLVMWIKLGRKKYYITINLENLKASTVVDIMPMHYSTPQLETNQELEKLNDQSIDRCHLFKLQKWPHIALKLEIK